MMQELSMNILDVAQNSVAAGASLVEITVEERPREDLLRIVIADNGRGMTPDQVRRVTDPFYTTRTTRKVGLGIPFFKMAAELSGGGLVIESRPGEGTRVEATFGLGSIDRMPLGNINETVAALIQGSPQLDFLYTRRLEDREMVLDTREFREVLGEIPLDAPEVARFIREYLEEHTAALCAGEEELPPQPEPM